MPDDAKAKVQRAVNDPDFLGLGADEQRKVLAGVSGDSSFLDIGDADLLKFTAAVKGPSQFEQAASVKTGQQQPITGPFAMRPGENNFGDVLLRIAQEANNVAAKKTLQSIPQQQASSYAGDQFPQLKESDSRVRYNMTAAMSGQQMATPEDQAEAEQGKKTGFVAGATTAATGALAGPLLAPTATTEQVGTGILGPSGQELMREVQRIGPSAAKAALTNPVVQNALKYVVGPGAGIGGFYKLMQLLKGL